MKMERGGGGRFPGQRVKELKEHVGIPVKDSSLMGMFEAVTGCEWVAVIGRDRDGDVGEQRRGGGGQFPGMGSLLKANTPACCRGQHRKMC